jgi:hypothetical protein
VPGPVRHQFLSEEWVAAVLSLQDEYRDRVTPPQAPLRLNGTVTDAPFGEGPIAMSLDTSSGLGVVRTGHLDDAVVTMSTDYRTAHALLVDGDPQAVIEAFMSGRILVQGDLATLITALTEAGAPDETRAEIAARVREITET